MPTSKYLAVNWVDGMKITKDHLIQQENFITEGVNAASAISLNGINYGLVAPENESGRSLNLKINVDPSKIIKVNLLECHAITRGGAPIEIAAGSNIRNSTDSLNLLDEFDYSESKEKVFYVMVSVNLFARIPAGQMDGEEVPPRQPFVLPKYMVEVIPASQLDDQTQFSNSLLIGKLQLNAGRMQVVDRFIPACMLVKSFPTLHDAYFNLGNQLGETANLNLSIVQKILAKSSPSSLVKSFLKLSEKVGDFLANELGRFRWILADMPPVFLLEQFIRFAYIFKLGLDTLPAKDKEELINYFAEWMEMTPSEIIDKLNEMIKGEYNHNDISITLIKAEDLMNMIHALFTKLNALDFIGKKKGERAFVQERTFEEVKEEEPVKKPKNRGFSFLPD